MARMEVHSGEWWPVLSVDEPTEYSREDYVYEIPDDLVARYQDTLKAFDAVQEELFALTGIKG